MGTISVTILIFLIFICIAIASLIVLKIKGRLIPNAVIAVLFCFATCIASVFGFINYGEDYDAYKKLQWQTLTPDQIQPLVDNGYTVFIDVTADWCNICYANKAGVTHREKIVNALTQKHIILMQGDWSQPNMVVENYLQMQGLNSVPYNRVYGPGAPNGIVLPSQLTVEAVMFALEKAKG
ncbi:thiol:disulfide interchange protein, putative [Shewanella halifaxensis HAW-EB4]|uniref:Thiol:disulfide interchange protein, putative n=1 Tax=Shewanella halifaxensis (strain HAW-EB4) TaxID=458817 RepID=B0TSI6_SHEHH|nr:thioredoxin family protein [Shewanella halifaxensis]ABZ77940.1 thiol:disulfide interchange protein, putative [Shewanella halifaxensis HAW-EB4]